MNENPTINYALALKNYSRNGKGRSMKKFCEDEGYDYDKFLRYSRRGRKSAVSSRRLTSVSVSPEGSSLLWWTDPRTVASASPRCASDSRTGWSSPRARAT